MTQTADIQNETVTYQVRQSERASKVRIDVGMDGIIIVLPENEDVEAETVLQENAAWVLRQRDKYARYRAQMPKRCFEEGETFPVLGNERELVIGEALFSHITDEAIYLAQDKVDETSVHEELERLYREEARRHFTVRADHFSKKMGIRYEQLQIRNQKTRWGSYSPHTGTLSLNFRLLMAPADIIDYVIVHELAHAEYPNHGPRFWRLVEKYKPDYEVKNEWLKENGTRLVFA
jgi:predicted metal-dependent hydrolase